MGLGLGAGMGMAVCKGWETVKVAWLDCINAMEERDEYYREVVIALIIVSSLIVIMSVPVIINRIAILICQCIVNHVLSLWQCALRVYLSLPCMQAVSL